MSEQPRAKVTPPIPDPGVSHGPYRPLQRTDGKFIVYSAELPVGQRTVGGRVFTTRAEADSYARECAAQPPPCPNPNAAPPPPEPGPDPSPLLPGHYRP